jgi:hypothetical protein
LPDRQDQLHGNQLLAAPLLVPSFCRLINWFVIAGGYVCCPCFSYYSKLN